MGRGLKADMKADMRREIMEGSLLEVALE